MKVTLRRPRVFCVFGFLGMAVTAVGCSEQQINDATATADGVRASAGEASNKVVEATGAVKDKVSQEFSVAWEKASNALKDVEGGGEMLTGMKEVFSNAKAAFEGVTDEASAENAKTKLSELGKSVDGWREKVDGLSEESKVAIKGFLEKGIAQLNTFVESFQDNQLVQTVLKPKFDELIEQLKNLV